MNDTPTPRTDDSEIIWTHLLLSDLLKWPNGQKTGLVPKDKMQQLETELTAVTAQRDRLAEALERLEKTAGLPALQDDPARVQARQALQSLTSNTKP